MTALSPEELRGFYRLPMGDEELLEECVVSAFKSGGPGGQHKNKTLTSVRLRHRPSGLVVIGRRERSLRRNIADALERLRTRLEVMLTPVTERRETRPSRGAKEKRLQEKRQAAKQKRERSRKTWEE